MKVCENASQGQYWPSLAELKQSIAILSIASPVSARALPSPATLDQIRSTIRDTPLFRCIKAYSERREVRKHLKKNQWPINTLRFGKTTKTQLTQHEAELTQEIQDLMPTLEAQDAARLFREYEA